MTPTVTDPSLRRLARQLVRVDQRLKNLETVPQLAHSSIDDGTLPVYDKDGNLTVAVGRQPDGTWGAHPLEGPVPEAPSGITAVGGAGIIHARWNGTFMGSGAAPLDFDAIEVLVDGALAGALHDRDGGAVTIQADEGTRFVSARVRTLVPRHSTTTSPFAVQVRLPAEILFDDTTERADALADKLEQARAELDAAAGRLADAEAELDALDVRVDDVAERPRVAVGAAPPRGSSPGSHWVTKTGFLYVSIPCEEMP